MSTFKLNRLRGGLGLFLGMLMAITGVNLPGIQSPNDVAIAADMNQFDAGRIIDDSVFFNGNALNAQQVQAFLNSKMPQCTINNGQPSHAAGARYGSTTIADTCLKDYRQSTPTMAAQPGLCAQYPGSGSESAAEIIAKVGQVCNISQKVLLVLLDKEQSLVTDSWPTVRQYTSATGFACYDNGQPCVSDYNGFFYQVWSAARQFQRYGTGSFTWYPVGQVSNILYQANNPACGTKPVLIQNRATAALYYYTPYTPNWSALFGSGDECSAYGNRNFFRYFVDWFGSTKSEYPLGTLDSVALVSNAGQPGLRVSGWTFDPADSTLSSPIHIYVTDPSGRTTISGGTADQLRADVNAAVGITGNHGYSVTLPVSQPGTYKVCVYSIAVTSFSAGNKLLRCTSVVQN